MEKNAAIIFVLYIHALVVAFLNQPYKGMEIRLVLMCSHTQLMGEKVLQACHHCMHYISLSWTSEGWKYRRCFQSIKFNVNIKDQPPFCWLSIDLSNVWGAPPISWTVSKMNCSVDLLSSMSLVTPAWSNRYCHSVLMLSIWYDLR